MRIFRGLASLAACAALLAVGAAPASAANDWAAILDLSSAGNDSTTADVAAAPDGSAVAVWQQFSDCGCDTTIQSRRINADGSLGPVVLVSTDDPDLGVGEPQVAIGGDGVATVVWAEMDYDSGDFSAQFSKITGGTASPPVEIYDGGSNELISSPAVAATTNGNAMMTFNIFAGNTGDAWPAVVPISAAGAVGTRTDLSDQASSAFGSEIAVDASGRAIVSWIEDTEMMATTFAANGTPTATLDLAGGSHAYTDQVDVNGAGEGVVTWVDGDGTVNPTVFARQINANGTMSATVQELEQSTETAYYFVMDPDVAVDSSGNATAVWASWDGADAIVRERKLFADDTLGPAQDLSQGGRSADSMRVGVDQDGVATASWQWGFPCYLQADGPVACDAEQTPSAEQTIQARRIATDGTAAAVKDLSSNGENNQPALAVGDTGIVSVAWEDFDPDALEGRIKARQYRPVTPATAPICTAGSAATPPGTPITLPLNCVGDGQTILLASEPLHGTLGLVDQAAKTVLYTPTAGFTGTDSFNFNASNSAGASATVTETIAVGPPALILNDLKLSNRLLNTRRKFSFRFELSSAATVTMTLERKFGRAARARCNRTTPKNVRAKRCKIYRFVSKQTAPGNAGANTMVLNTKVRRGLHPGAYRLTVVATGPGGSASRSAAIFLVPWWGKYV